MNRETCSNIHSFFQLNPMVGSNLTVRQRKAMHDQIAKRCDKYNVKGVLPPCKYSNELRDPVTGRCESLSRMASLRMSPRRRSRSRSRSRPRYSYRRLSPRRVSAKRPYRTVEEVDILEKDYY